MPRSGTMRFWRRAARWSPFIGANRDAEEKPSDAMLSTAINRPTMYGPSAMCFKRHRRFDAMAYSRLLVSLRFAQAISGAGLPRLMHDGKSRRQAIAGGAGHEEDDYLHRRDENIARRSLALGILARSLNPQNQFRLIRQHFCHIFNADAIGSAGDELMAISQRDGVGGHAVFLRLKSRRRQWSRFVAR